MNLQLAKKLIEGAEREAKRLGVSMVISVVNQDGTLIAVHRMDEAWIASIEIAQNKAWTSAALTMPTENLANATVPNAELYGLNTTNDGKIVLFGGGIPLEMEGKIIGAVGVSGSSVENDIKVAKAAVRTLEGVSIKV